jgi:hypothetical protein
VPARSRYLQSIAIAKEKLNLKDNKNLDKSIMLTCKLFELKN